MKKSNKLLLALLLVVFALSWVLYTQSTDINSLPNPAAVNCIEQGFRYEIETATDGSQAGYCYVYQPEYSNKTYKCEEWQFYRGECPSCYEFCEGIPHIMCIGHWVITGTWPNCTCSYKCDTIEGPSRRINE